MGRTQKYRFPGPTPRLGKWFLKHLRDPDDEPGLGTTDLRQQNCLDYTAKGTTVNWLGQPGQVIKNWLSMGITSVHINEWGNAFNLQMIVNLGQESVFQKMLETEGVVGT